MGDNPIVGREIIDVLRQPRSFLALGGLLGLLSLALLIAWPGGEASPSRVASLSIEMFRSFAVAQLGIVALLCAVTASQSVVQEREGGTLQLLEVTYLTPLKLVVAKFFSTLVLVLLLSISTAPILALTYILGGISISEILGAYLVAFKYAILFTCIGLTVSSATGSTFAALTGAMVFSVPVLGWIINSAVTNPEYFAMEGHYDSILIYPPLIYICFAYAASMLGRGEQPFRDRPEVLQSGIIKISESEFPDNLLTGSFEMPKWMNPVFVKEFQAEVVGRNIFIKIFITGAMILGGIVLLNSFVNESSTPFQIYLLSFCALIAPALACNSVTKEKENKTALLLSTTTLTPDTIVRGKLMASVYFTLVLFMLVFLPCVFGALVSSYFTLLGLLGLVVQCVTVTAASAAIGLAFSASFSTMSRSTLATYLVLITVFVGPPLALWFKGGIAGEVTALTSFLLALSPVTSVLAHVKSFGIQSLETTIFGLNLLICWVLYFVGTRYSAHRGILD
jgi:ABC-type transport system involved in multi-copper enzyme maturation permease subunit